MFQIGDKILYGSSGACLIEQITLMRFGRTREQYYVLRPIYQNAAVIYVPVNNPTLVSKIRSMPSKTEVEQLLVQLHTVESVWIEDAQERKALFDQIMRNGDCADRVRLIKTLYHRKQQRLTEGKNLHVSDENFLRDAQRLLSDEFAYPLQLTPAEVSSYIQEQLAASII